MITKCNYHYQLMSLSLCFLLQYLGFNLFETFFPFEFYGVADLR